MTYFQVPSCTILENCSATFTEPVVLPLIWLYISNLAWCTHWTTALQSCILFIYHDKFHGITLPDLSAKITRIDTWCCQDIILVDVDYCRIVGSIFNPALPMIFLIFDTSGSHHIYIYIYIYTYIYIACCSHIIMHWYGQGSFCTCAQPMRYDVIM